MKFISFGITSLLLLCSIQDGAAAPQTITAADANRPIDLRVGHELILNLEANPSTGYSWFLTDPKHPVLIRVGEATYLPSAPRPGAGGVQSWTFRAAERGRQTLTLQYRRPWEKETPAKTLNFEVTVR